jgi:hypothetical protein
MSLHREFFLVFGFSALFPLLRRASPPIQIQVGAHRHHISATNLFTFASFLLRSA